MRHVPTTRVPGIPKMSKPKALSIVIPALNEQDSVDEMVDRIVAALCDTEFEGDYEIIYVDDDSTDDMVARVRAKSQAYPFLRVAVLRANFGKSMALMVGFAHARGELIVTMDADLQDCPEDIVKMIATLRAGPYDLVTGWRKSRRDTTFRRLGSWIYNKTIQLVTGLDIKDQNCGFKVYRRDLAQRLSLYGQFHRFMPLQAHLNKYRVGQCVVTNHERKHGASRYRAVRYEGLFDLLSVVFSNKYRFSPLYFFGKISLLLIVPSFLIVTYLTGLHLWSNTLGDGSFRLSSRPMLILPLFAIMMGMVILMTGFVCDFILYHHARASSSAMIDLALLKIYEAEDQLDDQDTVIDHPRPLSVADVSVG